MMNIIITEYQYPTPYILEMVTLVGKRLIFAYTIVRFPFFIFYTICTKLKSYEFCFEDKCRLFSPFETPTPFPPDNDYVK